MSVPSYLADGNFTTYAQCGPGEYSLPFQSEGDTRSYEYRARFRIKASSYTPRQNSRNVATGDEILLQTISTARGTAYLINESDPQDIGAGILEVTRTYAMYYTRYVAQSYVLPYQFLSTSATYDWDNPPADPQVAELPIPLNARIKWEYGLSSFTQIVAPKVAVVFGLVFKFGGWGNTNYATGDWFPAENSEQGIYNGFHFRKTIQVLNVNPSLT